MHRKMAFSGPDDKQARQKSDTEAGWMDHMFG